MAFTPTTWADGEAGGTPITAAQLNRIEAGVEYADGEVDVLRTEKAALEARVDTLEADVAALTTRVETLEAAPA